MELRMKKRIAWALKCDPTEVPEEPEAIAAALEKRRAELKKAKALKGVEHG